MLMARVAGTCLIFGSVVVAALVTISPLHFHAVGAVYCNAVVAAVSGVAAVLIGPRMRLWQFQVLVIIAIGLITSTVYLSAEAPIATSVATLYAFVAFAAFFLSWPQSIAYLSLAVVCCILVLRSNPYVPNWSALIAAGTTVLMGAIIAGLGQLMSNSERDLSTGLPNRHGFDRILKHAVAKAQLGGPRPVVVLLLLDGLDDIGDRFGLLALDQMIANTLEKWRPVLRPEYQVARLADAEFAILLPAGTEHEGVTLSHRIRLVTSSGCAAGVTGWQPDEVAAVVLSRADVALRRAKRSGLNRTMLESASLPSVASELADAIGANAVTVLYQPIVSLAEGHRVLGVEALARWESPTRPDLAISEVIAVAENSNLIATLDRYVLRRACTDVRWLQQQRVGVPLTLTVNVSGLELIEKGYAAGVAEILEATGWPPQQLVLEVTESVVDVDTPASVAALEELRSHGIRVAIDDFGTGYSTLSRLQALPIDLLKLDASFTARTNLDPACAPPPMLQAISALAKALKLPVVIEGVETEQQALALQRVGFAMAQGYLFGRPQKREGLVDLLAVG